MLYVLARSKADAEESCRLMQEAGFLVDFFFEDGAVYGTASALHCKEYIQKTAEAMIYISYGSDGRIESRCLMDSSDIQRAFLNYGSIQKFFGWIPKVETNHAMLFGFLVQLSTRELPSSGYCLLG